MKKIFLIGLMVGLLFTSQSYAQRATVFPLVSADSLTNADTVNKVITLTAGYSGISIQPIVTKVSGTAAGSVVLYESLDGTNYKSTGDTLSLTNTTTQSAIWHKTSPVPVYYKVTGISSGTVVEILRVYYVARRHD
jgi:hypothetical protein